MNQSQQNDSRWYPQHPMVATHPVVLNGGKILLAKRAKEPSKGHWSLPGGRIELGETVYKAAKRELIEECSIEIEIERLLDTEDLIIKDKSGKVSYHFVIIYLIARYKSGNLKLNEENTDIGWFAPAEITGLDIHPQLRAVLVKAGLA